MADQIDPNSQTWRAVKAWAEGRRERSRSALEAQALPASDTEFERGKIAAVRELLALAEPKVKTAHSTGFHVE